MLPRTVNTLLRSRRNVYGTARNIRKCRLLPIDKPGATTIVTNGASINLCTASFGNPFAVCLVVIVYAPTAYRLLTQREKEEL